MPKQQDQLPAEQMAAIDATTELYDLSDEQRAGMIAAAVRANRPGARKAIATAQARTDAALADIRQARLATATWVTVWQAPQLARPVRARPRERAAAASSSNRSSGGSRGSPSRPAGAGGGDPPRSEPEPGLGLPGERLCGCGCGISIAHLDPQRVYLEGHKQRAYRRRQSEPVDAELLLRADAARALIAAGRLDPSLALSFVVAPTPDLIQVGQARLDAMRDGVLA
jgi:hypothetical protein